MKIKKIAKNYVKYIGVTAINAFTWLMTGLGGWVISKESGWTAVLMFVLFLICLACLCGIIYVTALMVSEEEK